jgi:hypothetical protein
MRSTLPRRVRHPVCVAESVRFRDYGHGLVAFSDLIYVVCPACTGRATVIERPGLPARRYESDLFFRSRRLSCQICAASREWTAGPRGAGAAGATFGGPADPFFGLPLWLKAPCQGHVLWAYNQRHLDVLERYVSARLRERRRAACEMGMLERLPAWIKAAGSREGVLRVIGHLRLQLRRTEPGTGPAST